MEEGDAAAVYEAPAHPYTRALLEAVPVADPELQRQRRVARQRNATHGVPAGTAGCPYAARYPHVIDRCRVERPGLEATHDGTLVACHRWAELPARPSRQAEPAAQAPDR